MKKRAKENSPPQSQRYNRAHVSPQYHHNSHHTNSHNNYYSNSNHTHNQLPIHQADVSNHHHHHHHHHHHNNSGHNSGGISNNNATQVHSYANNSMPISHSSNSSHSNKQSISSIPQQPNVIKLLRKVKTINTGF